MPIFKKISGGACLLNLLKNCALGAVLEDSTPDLSVWHVDDVELISLQGLALAVWFLKRRISLWLIFTRLIKPYFVCSNTRIWKKATREKWLLNPHDRLWLSRVPMLVMGYFDMRLLRGWATLLIKWSGIKGSTRYRQQKMGHYPAIGREVWSSYFTLSPSN